MKDFEQKNQSTSTEPKLTVYVHAHDRNLSINLLVKNVILKVRMTPGMH